MLTKTKLYVWLSSLEGLLLASWQRSVCSAFASGVFMTLAFSPFDLGLCTIPSLLSLLYLLHINACHNLRRAFTIGFFWGLGHFTSSLYWIAHSLLVEPDKFAWLIPFSVLLIPTAISIFIGCFACTVSFMIKSGHSRVICCFGFASGWVVFELLRSHSVLAFPWNLLGYSAASSLYFSQIISLIGINGAGFLVALTSAALYSKNKFLIIGVCAALLASSLYGYYRVHHDASITRQDIKIRIVQPNFQDFHFGDPIKQQRQLIKVIQMSNQAGYEDIKLTIWPESAFPFYVTKESAHDLLLLKKSLKSGGILAFGADSYSSDKGSSPTLKNSLFFLNTQGNLQYKYDKVILVPFGEYVPFKTLLPSLDRIVGSVLDFSPGVIPNGSVFIEGIGDILPMICFEAIFEALYINVMTKNLALLLNITNDFWFGDSIGPYQHFTMSKMRAIEYGTSLVRVANSGISAVVDCYGRVEAACSLNTECVLDHQLQIRSVGSPYVDYGLRSIILSFLTTVFMLCMLWRLRGRWPHKVV